MHVSLVAVLFYAVDEPRQVGEPLRSDDQGLIGVFAGLQLHQTVILTVFLELHALSEANHLTDVLAYQRFRGNIFISDDVITLSFDLAEDIGTNWHLLVLFIGTAFLSTHEIDAKVHALFVEDIREGFKVDKFFCVPHSFLLDGCHQLLGVFVELLLVFDKVIVIEKWRAK